MHTMPHRNKLETRIGAWVVGVQVLGHLTGTSLFSGLVWSIGWLIGCLAGWRAGWLAAWLAAWLDS
jgi:hypothetical protein